MLSIQKQFLFVHVPKTGGNSIQNILRDHSEDDIVVMNRHQDGVERFEVRNKSYKLNKHSTLSHYKTVLPNDVYCSLFKFATIRNPWDMMVSFYFSPHRNTTEFRRDEFLDLVEKTPTLRHYICESSLFEKTIQKLGLRTSQRNKPNYENMDFLIRFEQLDHDFKLVCEKLNIPYASLPKRNSSRRAGAYSG